MSTSFTLEEEEEEIKHLLLLPLRHYLLIITTFININRVEIFFEKTFM